MNMQQKEQFQMAEKIDLKMIHPFEEEYGSTPEVILDKLITSLNALQRL